MPTSHAEVYGSSQQKKQSAPPNATSTASSGALSFSGGRSGGTPYGFSIALSR